MQLTYLGVSGTFSIFLRKNCFGNRKWVIQRSRPINSILKNSATLWNLPSCKMLSSKHNMCSMSSNPLIFQEKGHYAEHFLKLKEKKKVCIFLKLDYAIIPQIWIHLVGPSIIILGSIWSETVKQFIYLVILGIHVTYFMLCQCDSITTNTRGSRSYASVLETKPLIMTYASKIIAHDPALRRASIMKCRYRKGHWAKKYLGT